MSGSGGGGFSGVSPSQIRAWIDQEKDETINVEHEALVNEQLSQLLTIYNERDTEHVRDRLDEIQDALEETLETTIDLRFGGSIAKHTFINGLSDVDALAVLKDPELQSIPAGEVLDIFTQILSRELGYEVQVNEGRLAVTVSFPGELEIQILPAVRTKTGIRIPASVGDHWSPVIRPEAFARKLTERNQANAGRVVPVIKLAKAAMAELPERLKPTGYHVESLAVEAFQRYDGPKSYKSMLHHFFEKSKNLVLSPMKDNTGQSLHVDENLGPSNSRVRRSLSGAMDRIARRMSNADRANSPDDWLQAIGE